MSRRVAALGMFLLLVTLAGCTTKNLPGIIDSREIKILQARAAYERGVKHMEAREIAAAFNAFREAVLLDEGVAHYFEAYRPKRRG